MATRFAGDYFGIALGTPQVTTSKLLEYFPDLRSAPTSNKTRIGGQSDKDSEIYREVTDSPVFGGFKRFEKRGGQKSGAPVFGGFKTFEQPKERIKRQTGLY